MNKLTRMLNFQQAAEILGVVPDAVRSLVVEERRIPAVYITQVAHSAEPYHYQLLKVDSEGRAFDMAVGGMEATVHTGFIRIERVALEKFIYDEGLVLSKMLTPTKLAEESSRSQPLECGLFASSNSLVIADSADAVTLPLQRGTAQEVAILDAIRAAGYDPLKLPKRQQGKRGIKAEVRATLVGKYPIFPKTGGQFDKAWERLRSRGEITELE